MKTPKHIKLISFILSVTFLLTLPLFVSANQSISVYMNNEKINFDVDPVLMNGRTMVPMRAIFEKLGAVVDWDDETNTAFVMKGYINISITIGSSYMVYRNMRKIPLDSPAVLHNNRTLVPLRAVSEAFKCTVLWDGNTNTVNIYDESFDGVQVEVFDDISANINQIKNMISKGLYLEAIQECKNARDWHKLSADDTAAINNLEKEAQQKYNEYVEQQKMENKNKKVTDEQKKELYPIIKEQVSLQLKSPSTAIWPDYTEIDYWYNEDGKLVVFGKAEAMNGFGGFGIVSYMFIFNEDLSIDFKYIR